jgi:hypothetical protein
LSNEIAPGALNIHLFEVTADLISGLRGHRTQWFAEIFVKTQHFSKETGRPEKILQFKMQFAQLC